MAEAEEAKVAEKTEATEEGEKAGGPIQADPD